MKKDTKEKTNIIGFLMIMIFFTICIISNCVEIGNLEIELAQIKLELKTNTKMTIETSKFITHNPNHSKDKWEKVLHEVTEGMSKLKNDLQMFTNIYNKTVFKPTYQSPQERAIEDAIDEAKSDMEWEMESKIEDAINDLRYELEN